MLNDVNASDAYEPFLIEAFQKHYEKKTDVWTQDKTLEYAARYLRSFLQEEGHVLDIGAGRGRDSSYFLESGFHVTAADLVETPEISRLRENPKFAFAKGLFQETRLETKFIAALDNGSFHHQDPADFSRYLRKVYASLKTGGYFLLTTYTPFEEGTPGRNGKMSDGRKGRSFSLDEIRAEVEAAGFEFVESRRLIQESGQAYYLAACFRKKAVRSVLLLTPLPRAVQAAAELGYETISVWHRLKSADSLFPLLPDIKRDSNVYIEDDLMSEEGLKRTIARLREMRFDEAFYNGPDPYMQPVLQILADLGYLKDGRETFEIMHRKDKLRAHLREIGLSPVETRVVTDAESLRKAAGEIGFPMIVKPVNGGYSKNIHLLQTDEEATRLTHEMATLRDVTWIAEEFMEGTQVSVEAMTYGPEDHHMLGVTEKFPVTAPHFVENGGVFPARLEAGDIRAIQDLLGKLLSSVGFTFGPSHTEMILTEKGPRIVETHARSGGLIPFLVESATGICLHKAILLSAIGEKPVPTRENVSVLKFVEFEIGRKIKSISGRLELADLSYVQKHNIWVRPGQVVPAITSNESRHGYVVTFGKNIEEAEARAAEAFSKLRVEYEE